MDLRILVLALILWAGIASAQERKLESLRVGISSFSASYAPIFVAQKRGFYQEEGLTVEIILLAGLVGVTREVRPDEIFSFSHLKRVAAEVEASGWKP